jgi:hypothetical protein
MDLRLTLRWRAVREGEGIRLGRGAAASRDPGQRDALSRVRSACQRGVKRFAVFPIW